MVSEEDESMCRLEGLGATAVGVLVLSCAGAGPAAAAIISTVPEIDASVVPAALGVITAGVLMLRARRRSK
jgi:hypothetical protein